MPATASLFPHQSIRPGQDQLIKDINSAFTDGKILLAHAPTGLGKTASSLTMALQYALKNKKRVFFLTNRHTQHQIAIKTINLMEEKTGKKYSVVDLIGKRGMCSQDAALAAGNDFNEYCRALVSRKECEFYERVYHKNSVQAEAKMLIKELKQQGALPNTELMNWSKERKMCSYEIALQVAKDALAIIGDYHYVFNPFVRTILFKKLEIELEDIILVVDEGHNLPNRVTEILSTSLTTFTVKSSLLEAKKFGLPGLQEWLQGINRVLTSMAHFDNSKNKEKLITKDEFVTAIQKFADYETLLNELEIAADEIRKQQPRSFIGGLASFLDSWRGKDEGFVRILAEKETKYGPSISLSYSCLDPSIITKDIFSNVSAGMIMSGTLKPTFMFKDILGVQQGLEQEYSSPFPPENKLSLIVPETSTKYTLRGKAMYLRIAEKCAEIAELIPGNVAFFFPSYDLRNEVGNLLNSSKRQFWEKNNWTKEEKEEFLNQFKAEKKKGGILLGVNGANFAEGIDLPGDLLNGVVVVGLPLSKPDLKTRELINYYDQKFGKGWDYGYVYPAMNKCLQSAGRCIRSETDKGAIIFLDERFAWQNYFCCFPREGLIVSKDYSRLLGEFFGE